MNYALGTVLYSAIDDSHWQLGYGGILNLMIERSWAVFHIKMIIEMAWKIMNQINSEYKS